MSDGLSDARAMDEIDNALHTAAAQLQRALKSARNGHRGWALSTGQILQTVNEALAESGFKLEILP